MYFPVARDMERGLEVQNGYKQALKQMGFETKAKERTAQMQWERSEKQELERLGREHGLEIEHKHGNREHFQKDVYKAFAEKEVAEKELESTRNSLQDNKHALDYIKKDLAETREEIEQIKARFEKCRRCRNQTARDSTVDITHLTMLNTSVMLTVLIGLKSVRKLTHKRNGQTRLNRR